MIVKSYNGKFLYARIGNPYLNVWRMDATKTCYGCTRFSFEHCFKSGEYMPYCNIFEVWNNYNGEYQPVLPNSICLEFRRIEAANG